MNKKMKGRVEMIGRWREGGGGLEESRMSHQGNNRGRGEDESWLLWIFRGVVNYRRTAVL